ncbi:MAG: VWA domain-containing protein [Pseudomonadales bacterium]|nr:VWA domain-containing protein [Pseudomonadales bacterium]NIX09498.1 VWA domain-containing protein [Pseudomonadales bacterium]
MTALVDVEEPLALFAEGIAGRYYHIKAVSEYSGSRMVFDPTRGALTGDALLLPETFEMDDAACYRVLALEQLSIAEFGTLDFSIAEARNRIPAVEALAEPVITDRASDLERFFNHVARPSLLGRLFALCERVRLNAQLRHQYPGIRRHQDALHAVLRQSAPAGDTSSVAAILDGLGYRVLGGRHAAFESHPLVGALLKVMLGVARLDADVFDSAAAAYRCYELCMASAAIAGPGTGTEFEEDLEDAASWLQREARLEDWEEDLKQMSSLILAAEAAEGEEAVAADVEGLEDGEIRPEDVDLRTVSNERDVLARRLDMERATIRDAVGRPRPEARSYRYDEWDYLKRTYRTHWCRLFEEHLAPDTQQELDTLRQAIRRHRPAVQRQLEHIKPLGYQRVTRVADGDELDFNAVIQARSDIRAGLTPDERVYSRRERVHRDVCAAFLVDLSASTDDPVDPPPTEPLDEDDAFPNLRDPYDLLSSDVDPATEPRRIIDVQKESMLAMSAALEQLGDSYGIYGFSGYGRECVEFFVAKEPDQPFTSNTLSAIAGMKPKRSTRMGPAIRHAVTKLLRSGHALKVLMILSDGFPQDSDYGPERGDHEYGVQDTAKALREAEEKGIETFCVTVDRSGHDYLRRMCPNARYLVIEETEDLPAALGKVYEALTG